MALISEKEFDNLCIPIFDKDLILNEKAKQIFGSKLNKNNIALVKYIVLMYDQKSPYRSKITDLKERKAECRERSGLETDPDEEISREGSVMVSWISSFLRFQNSKVWAALIANEEVLWQYQQELLLPITIYKDDKSKLQALEIKSKLMQECDSILKRIDAYEEKIFGINFEYKKEILGTSPESIAGI